MSAVQFQPQLGLKRYETAFQILHKLRVAVVCPDRGRMDVTSLWVGSRTHGEDVDGTIRRWWWRDRTCMRKENEGHRNPTRHFRVGVASRLSVCALLLIARRYHWRAS